MRAAALLALCLAGATAALLDDSASWSVLAEPHDADAAVGSALAPRALLRRLRLAADSSAPPELGGGSSDATVDVDDEARLMGRSLLQCCYGGTRPPSPPRPPPRPPRPPSPPPNPPPPPSPPPRPPRPPLPECTCQSYKDLWYNLASLNRSDPATPQLFYSDYYSSWPQAYRDAAGWPTPEHCCEWCRNSWDCAYWVHQSYDKNTTLEAHCFFYDKLPPLDPLPQDYDTVYAKLVTGFTSCPSPPSPPPPSPSPPPPGPSPPSPPPPPPPPPSPPPSPPPPPPPADGSYYDPTVSREGSYSLLASDMCSVCGNTKDGDLGCRALYGAPRVQPLNDYRLIYFVKKCLDAYIAKYKVMVPCGDDVRLYSSPLIKFSKACTQLVSGRAWYLSVRVGYPCFGTPRRVNGKIVGYPAWGRYRVHNLYCNIWQKASVGGVLQPYDVNEFYRF